MGKSGKGGGNEAVIIDRINRSKGCGWYYALCCSGNIYLNATFLWGGANMGVKVSAENFGKYGEMGLK